jgi:hypothetical protein
MMPKKSKSWNKRMLQRHPLIGNNKLQFPTAMHANNSQGTAGDGVFSSIHKK